MKNSFKKMNQALVLTVFISLMSVAANAGSCPGSGEDDQDGQGSSCEIEKLLEPAPRSIELACNADGSPSDCDTEQDKKLFEPLHSIQLV
jgi:hypothetical protein